MVNCPLSNLMTGGSLSLQKDRFSKLLLNSEKLLFYLFGVATSGYLYLVSGYTGANWKIDVDSTQVSHLEHDQHMMEFPHIHHAFYGAVFRIRGRDYITI